VTSSHDLKLYSEAQPSIPSQVLALTEAAATRRPSPPEWPAAARPRPPGTTSAPGPGPPGGGPRWHIMCGIRVGFPGDDSAFERLRPGRAVPMPASPGLGGG
jgi:hypothetical protein